MRAVPFTAQRNCVARDTCFRPRQQTIFTHDHIDQRRFTRVRAPDNRDLHRLLCCWHFERTVFIPLVIFIKRNIGLWRLIQCAFRKTIRERHQLGVEIVQTFAVFRR